MKRGFCVIGIFLSLMGPCALFAQEAPDPIVYMQAQAGPAEAGNIIFQRRMPAEPGFPRAMVAFGGTEFMIEGSQVKGAPFSAESTTETVQALADGNRITNTSTSKIYRDSEGRTRREVGPGAQAMAILPFAGEKVSHPEVMISDPVAGVNYMLDINGRKATKLPAPKFFNGKGLTIGKFSHSREGGSVNTSTFTVDEPGQHVTIKSMSIGDVKAESLGTQTIEGIQAEGRRVTTTIPAGKIGNELPIVSTTETWFSPKLQRVILSKRHDPRFGDTTFKLTNIDQSEPSPSLFQVPSDFTVTDFKTEMEQMQKQIRKELQQNKPEMERMRKELQQNKQNLERMAKEMQPTTRPMPMPE